LLRACRVYKNIEFAELALGKLIEFEPKSLAIFDAFKRALGPWKMERRSLIESCTEGNRVKKITRM
jgi:hypothetical protein